MTVLATRAGAPPHRKVNWYATPWRAVHRNVRRLQARIVKATQESRWGKVKALQHLLTHSFSGKALAVKRVTENQGKQTPGVDRITWNTSEKKEQAIQQLRQRGYQALPLRRVYIPKSNHKLRPLGIPTMTDRAMQALYLLALDPIAEVTGDRNSYGFRTERSTADAIEQCFTVLSRKWSPQWILEGDIKSCYDGIDHDWLLTHIPMDKVILRKWLKAGFLDKCVLHATEMGTPQGGIISPVLANLALDGLERKLREKYPANTRTGNQAQVNLVRYADDFIITSRTKERLEEEVKPLVEKFLQARGLELSSEKTKITHIEDGFDFLGQNIRKYNGKPITKPAAKNVKAFLGKIRAIVKANQQARTGNLIAQLNPVIRGWANHHRHGASSNTFSKVDCFLFKALWQWAKRRHPKKSSQWVKETYFATIKGRGWVFHGKIEGKNGETQDIQLFRAASTRIQRHIKIKGDANPYDPQWEMYFKKRLGIKMAHNLKGKGKLLYLWKEQKGICPICHQKITQLTGWHNHHIVWRTKGGGEGAENRVLLHPHCHSQIHNQGETVVKPRLAKGV